jgi:S1-C subfamily serine protease
VPIALILAALILIAAGVVIGHGLWTRTVGSARPIPSTQPTTPQSPSSGPTNAGAIASQVDPSLVDINTTLSYQQAEGAGTGMVLTPGGEILTNNHVIEGATNISVTDIGNGRTYGATVVGYDVTRDLAIIQLQGASNLHTVSIGDSSKLSVGDKVVGIGNAQGRGGTPSYAGGTVTALNQTITASDALDGSRQLSGLVESSTYIQPGDSGGPVVNQNGQVVAMDTAAAAGFAGFQSGGSPSYSIPINEAITVFKQIEVGRSSSTVHIGATAFLGVQVSASNTPGIGGGIGGFSPQTPPTNGVVVAAVLSGDPAEQAGMVAGDVITKVGSVSVDSPSALTDALLAYHPGVKVQISWTDTSGQSQSATVQLASGPPQ